MKQSTFSAVMANSIKNLLQGYTKGIRFTAILTLLFTIGVGQIWAEEATLSFASTAQRTSFSSTQQVWEQNGIKFTNNKASSTSNVADYAKPTRLYASSNVIVEHTSKQITQIVFDCNSSSYATAMMNSIGTVSGATVTVSSDKVTVAFTSTVELFTIAKLTAQVRLDAITVTYQAAYTFHYGEKDKSYQKIDFKQVGNTNEWTISDFEFPNVNTNQACYVGYNGYWYNSNLGASNSKSADLYFWNMPLAKLQNDNACSNVNYLGWDMNSQNGHKVIGTLRIYDNDSRDNLAIAFVPDGYGLCYGKDGQAWSNIAFNGNDDVVTTNVITLTKEMINGTYKYYVGLLTSDGGYAFCGNSSTLVMKTMGSYYTSSWHNNVEKYAEGQAGVFRIWTNSCNGNNTPNFVCHFVPYYRVSYDLNGGNGTALPSQWYSCESGTQTITLPAKPTRDGYRFKGWGTLSVDATTYSFTPTSNVTLQAQWEKVYTVTFDLQGHGTAIDQQTVVAGSKATKPADPSATGYTFGGWYKESACTNVFDFNTAINANTTIYAKWTAKKYTYTLYPNTPTGATVVFKDNSGNSVEKIAIVQTYDESVQSFENFYSEISCEGYRFDGWYSATSGGSKWTQTQSKPTDDGNFNFYARWTKLHTITWKVNGQQYGEKQEVVDGQTIGTLPKEPSAPTSCSGKVFMGWTESATVNNDGTGITYITTSTKPDGDKTYHAVFATEEGGGLTDVIDKLTYEGIGLGIASSGNATYTNFSDKTFASDAVYAGMINKFISSSSPKNVIQIRSKESNSGIITTKSGGKATKVVVEWFTGTGGTQTERKLDIYGKNSAYSAAADLYTSSSQGTKLGSIVCGTSTELTISDNYTHIGLRSSDGAMYLTSVSITWSAGSEPTYTDYVTSCIPQYTITLNLNGGTFAATPTGWTKVGNNYTQTVNENTTLDLPTPTKKGYTYNGWKKNNTGNPVTSITVSETATYTASYDCDIRYVAVEGIYALVSGQKFELTAIAQDENHNALECPNDAVYTWQRKDAGGNWIDVKGNESTDKNKLVFNSCEIAHCGTYRCHITYGDCGAYSNPQTGDDGYRVHVFHLKGNFENDWTKEYTFTATADVGIATLSIDLVSGHTHKFKIYDGIYEYGNGGTISASVTDWTYGSDNNQNTTLQTGADGTYVFTLDFTELINNSTNVLSLDVTYPPSNQSEGYIVYYDNFVHNWTNVYYRIGHTGHNMNSTMELVPGTSHLYKSTTPEYNDFEAWQVANNVAWSGEGHSIYKVNTGDGYAITHATEYKKFVVVEDITLTPDVAGAFVNGENCTYYPAAKQAGMKKHNAKIIASPTGGTITVSYTDHDGTAKSDFTSGDRDLAHTCLLTITATPDAGYSLGTLTVNDVPFTSGKVHTLAEDAVIKVVWTEKATSNFAWSAATCTAALEADNTFPTLSNPDNLFVTYSSSKPDIAKIDENGDVILGAVGETEITATGAETATHKSATTTYKLTVVESNCRWVEVEIGDIEPDDEVLVTMKTTNGTYTLDHSKESSEYPPAIAITVNGNEAKYNSTKHQSSVWNISGNTTDGYVLYPNGSTSKWLYCTSTAYNVKVGTYGKADNNYFFTIVDNYLKNKKWEVYIGVCNFTDWRHYPANTGNAIAGQTLKFYKRECLDATNYWVTWDAGEGTWEDKSSKKLESYAVGADINQPADPSREGYRFDGWEPTPTTMPAENTTFTAKWTQMHTITWMVGSTSVLTEVVANATGVTQTPGDDIADDAIGDCANAFMGWSETPLGSAEGQSAPSDLCTAAQMKSKHSNVTGNKTFYAVFATATTTPGTSTTTNKTYSHTITATTWDAAGERTLSNVSWALSDNGDYYGYDGTKGQQVGSSKKPAKSMTLTTSGFASASKITSVTINTSGASGTNAKVSVKVGGTSYSCNSNATPSITTSATDYKFTGNATGDIVISWTQTTSTAIYFKSITVEYSNTTTTPDVTTYSNYVTNCCALAPATNLTVSGTTSNTATLTWTAPSPTTGITKLQVRNADNDAVVVDDVAVGTTTATITGLTECTSYQYYVVFVGEECEVVSNIVTAQPFGNAKTVNYNYNGGSGTETSFTTNCEEQEVTLPTATRAGYDFNGWYTAATGGTKVGDAGGTYNPTTSPITLYAQWTKQIYIISFHANGGTGTMPNQSADENNVIAQLNANKFTRDGYAFVGWNTTAGGTGTAYVDQATNITLTQNRTLYAQWAAIVTLNDAGNETTTHPATAGGSITLEDGANACDPYEFVGWTAVATGDWNEGINEPALVATTYTPSAPTTLYAVYKIQSEGNANAFKLSFEGGNGKTYYVGEYGSSPYLRGFSDITKEEAVTFIRTKMYPNDDTKYYLYLEYKEEYYYYNSSYGFSTTSSDPNENQGWVFHTVGDKIQIQAIGQERYLSYVEPGSSDTKTNITTHATGSQKSFNMLPAVTSTYVASPLCNQEIEIIFETGNGDFVANAPYTNPFTVSRGDVITLPTCEYPGYEFMGWLKDEQQLDPSDIPLTYYTGDYTVNGTSSTITFYAYYKAIPEEVEFTGKDDAELLMYYYDGTANYYYAVSHAAERGELSSKQNCFNATTWTFTSVGNMQYHIQDETGKYLGAYSDGDNDLILSATPKVWTFTEVNGLWKMVCENSPSRALMYISTGKTFANAAISNEGNGAYSYVSLGICPSPTYTTNPVLSQGFVVTNTAMVTSAVDQKVKAASTLTLETRNIELPCTFTITAPNITFYDNTGAEVTQLTASAASEQFELYFAYKPTAENTIEYPTVTITDDEHKTYTIKNRIYARSLPATFAIVAKVGNIWYALPSQGLNSTTPPAAYPVEVDDMADPTAVTAVPANADWSLRGVYEALRSDATKDRYVANGDNLVFVNNASPAMTLNASSSEEENYLLADAQYNNYYGTNPGLYEWTPTTTDLETYQLTNEQRSRKLSVNTATVFGVHAQNKAVEQVRFLPIKGRYTPLAAQVVEWKENSVVVMYNGDPTQTASVSVNAGEAQTTELSGDGVQKDIAVYELAADGLATNPRQMLKLVIGSEQLLLPIPYIIGSATDDATILGSGSVAAKKEIAKVADLVVLKGGKLTANGAASGPFKFRNVTIYGGGKLVIPSDKGFGVSSLTMRVGAVESGNYKALYPQLVLNGTINSGNINIDYLTTYDRYYALSLPYEVATTDILYPTDIYGDVLNDGGNKASFALQWYDGEARASETRKGWTDLKEPATLARYQGYTFWGAPRKVSVNGGESKRQNFGIHRIPIKPTADELITGETSPKQIDVKAHPAANAYDAGWNFIGNPYLVQYGNMEDGHTSGLLGALTQNPETGVWEHTGNYRYITLTDDGKTYWQTPVSEADLYPFNTFFVQAGENGAVSFNASNRASLPARHYAAQQETAKEITTGIILTGNDQTDRTGLLIADNFTEEYDFNADLSKFENSGINLYTIGKDGNLAYMAINQALAEQPIPVGYSAPVEGLYTIAFDEDRYNATDISALYLIDYDSNEKTNLLHTDYSFVTAAGTNNERFALQVAFAPENATNVEWVGDATIQVGVESNELILHNLPTDAAVHVFDALGRLMYHTPHAPTEMQLTLPTGYYLVRIADKQHAAVINTVIP